MVTGYNIILIRNNRKACHTVIRMVRDMIASEGDVAVSELLRKTRMDSGVSQAKLARCVGESQSFVSKYENAQRRLSVVEFIRVARALRVNPSMMISELDKRI